MNVTSCTQHSAGSGTIPYDAEGDSEMTGVFMPPMCLSNMI